MNLLGLRPVHKDSPSLACFFMCSLRYLTDERFLHFQLRQDILCSRLPSQILAESPMTKEGKFAILFSATVVCARK
jgi:hypothetical protein